MSKSPEKSDLDSAWGWAQLGNDVSDGSVDLIGVADEVIIEICRRLTVGPAGKSRNDVLNER